MPVGRSTFAPRADVAPLTCAVIRALRKVGRAMKHAVFMLVLLVVTVPCALVNPFVGLAVYYGLALVRPQAMWKGIIPDWRWSLIVGLATLIGFAAHGFSRMRAGRRWTLEKKIMAVLCGLIMLSFVDAIDIHLARRHLEFFLKIAVMFFVACALLHSRYRLRVLAIVIVVSLGWVAFDLNQRYVLMGQKHIATLGFGTLDNNGLAVLMVVGMPFCVFWFTQERKWYYRLPPVAAMVLMLHVVLFSMSRAGMLGALISLPLFMLRLKRRWAGIVLTAIVVMIGIRLAGPPVTQRFSTISMYEQDASAMSRLRAWRVSIRVMRDHPIFGVGPDCFRAVAGEYDPGLKKRTMHNQFLQTAVDSGVPAGIAQVVMLVAALVNLQRLRRQRREDPFVCNLAACLQAGLVGYATVGMFASIGTVEIPYIVLAMTVGLRNIVAEESPDLLAAPTPGQRRKSRSSLHGLKPAAT